MCIATAALIASVAGSAIGAAGQIAGGYSANAQAQSNSRLDIANADMASMQSNQQAEQVLREGHQTIGAQSAAIAESGIGFSGTGNDVLQQSATNLSMDVLNTVYGGQIKNLGLRNEAANERYKGKQAIMAGWIGGASDLLKGAGGYLSGSSAPSAAAGAG